MNRALAVLGLILLPLLPAKAAETPYGSDELIAKAKQEGRIVLYSVNFNETEQAWIIAFNKRFPFVKVELVRAPGGQMITRIRTEAAAGKVVADVIDYSDRGHLKTMGDLYQAYAPPNAADFAPEAVTDPHKLWPRTTSGWCIAYNTALVDDPPKSWWDLTDPKWKGHQIAEVIAGGGGPPWNRALFQRQTLGLEYWQKLAANEPQLYPSGAPATDAIIRGEVKIGAQQTNIVLPRAREGAPIACNTPPEGIPLTSYGAGIPVTAKNVNAARLFLNWSLSREGQEAFVRDSAGFSALKDGPLPEGIDLKLMKPWYPNMDDYTNLQETYVAEWNKLNNYRQ
jgi:iron(III) transport system substrate-binding protein